MPRIIPSTKLRNEYNEVSREAHQIQEPIFVTKNGAGDLAVMSMETFELLSRRAELVEKLAVGHADVVAGRTVNARQALARLREELEP